MAASPCDLHQPSSWGNYLFAVLSSRGTLHAATAAALMAAGGKEGQDGQDFDNRPLAEILRANKQKKEEEFQVGGGVQPTGLASEGKAGQRAGMVHSGGKGQETLRGGAGETE